MTALTEVIENCTTNAPKGFALLNEKGPEGWISKIDLDKLNMISPWNCVLGQVYDGYESTGYDKGMTTLFKAEWSCAEHAHPYGFCTEKGYDYPDLTSEWSAIITAAREEAKVSA